MTTPVITNSTHRIMYHLDTPLYSFMAAPLLVLRITPLQMILIQQFLLPLLNLQRLILLSFRLQRLILPLFRLQQLILPLFRLQRLLLQLQFPHHRHLLQLRYHQLLLFPPLGK